MQQDYNTSMNRTTFALMTGLLALAGKAAAGITHVDAELAYRHDDNLSRAESGRDTFSDNAADLGLTLTWSQLLTPNSGLRLSGGLRLTEQARYEELSHVNVTVGLRYRIQPVAGYTAPWIELGTAVETMHHRDSNIRDGKLWTADVILGKRFTDRIGGRIGLGWEQRTAAEGEVFEWQRRHLSAAVDYRIGLDSTLYANLSRDFGDQVFTATPAPAFRVAAKAIEDDPVFGARRAYRLGAVASTLELGMSTPFNANNVLDIGLRHFRADADGGHSYDDTELRASWLYRFK